MAGSMAAAAAAGAAAALVARAAFVALPELEVSGTTHSERP